MIFCSVEPVDSVLISCIVKMYALGTRMPIKNNYDLICKTVHFILKIRKNKLFK